MIKLLKIYFACFSFMIFSNTITAQKVNEFPKMTDPLYLKVENV